MIKIYRSAGIGNNWIVTTAIGETYLKNWEEFALPSWMKYCDINDIGIVVVSDHLINRDDPYWKKPNWQKLLIPKLLVKNIPNISCVCYLDTDFLLNPYAPNIFKTYDGESYGLTSRVNNQPMQLELVQRQFVYLRNKYYDQDYPLDSVVFMSIEDQYKYSGLSPRKEAACTGLILFNPTLVGDEMENWFYKYTIHDDSVTGGEQTHLNSEILSTDRVQWLQYEYQADWVYEMAWKYPFLYAKGMDNLALIRDCIEASLFSNYFLHFGGSWHESEMWKVPGIMHDKQFDILNQGFQEYRKVKLTGEPRGHIKPKSKLKMSDV